MPLPVLASLVEEAAGLTPSLFNMPDQPTLDAFVGRFINRADAWMQGHMLGNYNLLTPSWAPVLQEEGQIYLALEKLSSVLKSLKTQGTHFPYVQEDSPAFQVLIETDWGKLAMAALDLWVTVEEIGPEKQFALPQLLVTDGIEPLRDNIEPMTSIYSEELDFARGISIPDIGTVRR
jgi:hypothetical protein